MAREAPLVLVVDDDADARAAILEALEVHGYPAVGASGAEQALATLRGRSEAFGVVLLDLRMPEVDGLAFRRLQRDDPRIASVPVVVMSGDTHVKTKASGLDFVCALTKPVSLVDLIDVVATFCGSRRVP